MTVVIEKRKPLSRPQVIQLVLDQEGRCGCGCGVKLDPMGEGVIDEHVRPLGQLGDNELSNRALYRKPCAKAKTAGARGDNARTAKAKRQGGEKGQWARRQKRGEGTIKNRKTTWPKRELRGRPFQRRKA